MATPTLGTAFVSIEGRTDKFGPSVEKGVTKSLKGLAGKTRLDVTGNTDKFAKSIEPGVLGSVTSLAKKAGLAFAAAFVVKKAFNFGADAVQFASNLNESITKIDAVFLTNSQTIKDWAKGANASLGQTQQQALEAAGTFGNLFRAFGVGIDPATVMSKKLVELATDLASFNNSTVDEALIALRSGLSGETEPLKRFGISLSDDRLKLKAFQLGLIASTKSALLPATKAQAAYALILQDSTIAQGDFARTSGGLANQQRILGATFKDIQTQIGTALLPTVLKITTALAKGLPHAFDLIRISGRRAVQILGPVFKELALAASAFFAAVREGDVTSDGFIGFVETVGNAIHVLIGHLADFAKLGVSNIVAGFQGLPGDGGPAASFFHFIGEAARGLFDFLTGPSGAAAVQAVKDRFADLVDFGKATIRFFQDNEAAASLLQVALAGIAAAITTIVVANKTLAGVNALKTALSGFGAIIAAGPVAIFAAAIVGLGVGAFVAYKKFKPFHDLVDKAIALFKRFPVPALAVAGALAAIVAALTTGPFVAVAVALVAVGAAVFLAYKRFKTFRDIVDNVGRALRTAFLASVDAVKTAVGAIRVAVGAISGFLGPILSTVAGVIGPIIAAIGRNIGPVLSGVGRGIADAFSIAKTVIGDVGTVISAIVSAVSGAVSSIGAFFSALGKGIAGTAVFKFLVEQAQNFAAFIREIAPQVAEAFGHLVAVFQAAAKILGAVFRFVGKVIAGAFSVAVDQVRFFAGIVRANVLFVSALWSRFGKFLTGPVKLAFDLILAGIRGAFKVLGTVFRLGIDAILFLWRKWGDDLARIVKGLFAPVVAVVKLAINTIANVIRLILAVINGDWSKAWEAAKRIVAGPIEFIVTILKGFVDVISGILGGIADTVSGIFHNAWDGIVAIVETAVGGVVGFVTGLPGRLVDAAGSLVSIVAGLFSNAWDLFTGVASLAVEGVIGFVTGLPGRIATAALGLVDAVKGLFGTAWTDLKVIVNVAIDNIVDFVKGLPDRIIQAGVAIFDAFKGIGSSILEGILEGLKAAGGFAGDVAKAIGNAVIDIVNSQVIDRINSIQIKIPIPFAKDITIAPPNIPKIPHLAQGGIAKRGRPVSAIIGDNKARDEVVAPLPPGFLKAMTLIAAGGGGGSSIDLGGVTIVESSDGRSTYADMVRAIRSAQWLAA